MRMSWPLLAWAQRNGLFFALAAMIAFFSLASERFFTSQNASVILLQVAVVGIVAVPGAMLVLAGFVDLSVGAVAVLSSVIFGQAMQAELGLAPSLIFGLATGSAWGVLNGYLIAYL